MISKLPSDVRSAKMLENVLSMTSEMLWIKFLYCSSDNLSWMNSAEF